ncbi:MAG: hypothetical protein QXV38_03155 [Conexivisphaerales archaeon]
MTALPGFDASAAIDYFSTEVLALGAIIAILAGLSTALQGSRSSGAAITAQGFVGLLYFYFLLHGGYISMSLAIANVTLLIGLSLTLMIYILYAGALLRALQGILIMAGR